MTREEQILKVGEEITSNPFELEGFIEGAEWADEHPQKKSKWSEEDEEWFNFTMDYLDNGQQEWLKSLKQRLEGKQ